MKKMNAPVVCLVFVGLCLFMMASWGNAHAADKTCYRCKKPIVGKFFSSNDRLFHEHCFTCIMCGKPIKGSFTLDGFDPSHPSCYLKKKNLSCAYCSKVLDKKWVESNGKPYHPDCYKKHVASSCDICGKPIHGRYVQKDGNYHESCYKKHMLETCVVCSQPIEGRHLVDAWNNKAHTHHGQNMVELCGSCGRIISDNSSQGGLKYSDGRIICGICKKTAVTSKSQFPHEKQSIASLLSSVGITDLPASIPLNLVDLNSLKRQSGNMFFDSARGYTLSKRYGRGHDSTRMEHTIFILSGLPLQEFRAVLAHEMLHVWLFKNSVVLSEEETEGFCNLGAMLVHQHHNTVFANHLLKQMELNPDPIYGEGYRQMHEKLKHLGWEGLIREVLNDY